MERSDIRGKPFPDPQRRPDCATEDGRSIRAMGRIFRAAR